MKKLRFEAANGVWRFAFAFDPKHKATILCAGNQPVGSQTRFRRPDQESLLFSGTASLNERKRAVSGAPCAPVPS